MIMSERAKQAATKSGPAQARSPEQQSTIEAMDSAAFDDAKFPREWLVKHVLVRGQPGVIGGPKKTLKTSLVIDLAVSIGTGRPFLGKFPVPKRRRVAVLSGESDRASLQETARRVCAARGVSLLGCDVLWSFRLPCLSLKSDQLVLRRFLHVHKVEVVFIDPLYLCLLGGDRPVAASNLYEVGPVLWQAAAACLGAGATPFFVHHSTKSASKRATDAAVPLDLDDLAFAGIGEFARQWVLLSRREEFDPRLGRHRLLLTAGGSAGHTGLWEVDVNEGALGDNFAGRKWQVTVREAGRDAAGGSCGDVAQERGRRLRRGTDI
jgi:hypothetical protein